MYSWYFIKKKDNQTEGDYVARLLTDGTFITRKVRVVQQVWGDFVFDDNYDMLSIDSLQQYVDNNNHLPNIPSEQEITDNGLDIGQMQALQMQKIEELTLYIFELNQKITEQQQEIEKLKQNK